MRRMRMKRSCQPAFTIERSRRREQGEEETLRTAVLFAYERETAKYSLDAAGDAQNKLYTLMIEINTR
ncbi:hypothetical protein NDU88_005233 [Pleurodeles waltl]|uniref:Uncharacterized protein n=1 Tax=Pleurodeles waltl TaxID=8319 RepID=A0AAV7WUL6_PLEWA|nr:hypothetical protein NDU88_005233 [Pleurodeles waltl]